MYASSLQGFGYGDVVYEFEKRRKGLFCFNGLRLQ